MASGNLAGRGSESIPAARPFYWIERMYILSLEIPWLPQSLNKSLRAHRFKRHKENQAWDAYIGGMVLTVGRMPPHPLPYARIRLVRHSHRMLDYDGLVGSLKPVVDALVSARVIADDSWKVLGAWDVDQRFRPKAQGPLLEIHLTERSPD